MESVYVLINRRAQYKSDYVGWFSSLEEVNAYCIRLNIYDFKVILQKINDPHDRKIFYYILRDGVIYPDHFSFDFNLEDAIIRIDIEGVKECWDIGGFSKKFVADIYQQYASYKTVFTKNLYSEILAFMKSHISFNEDGTFDVIGNYPITIPF